MAHAMGRVHRAKASWNRGCALAALVAATLCAGSAIAQAQYAAKPGVERTDVPQIGASVMLLGKFDWEIGAPLPGATAGSLGRRSARAAPGLRV